MGLDILKSATMGSGAYRTVRIRRGKIAQRIERTHMRRLLFSLLAMTATALLTLTGGTPITAQAEPKSVVDPKIYQDLRWRSVGPYRGGRSTAAAGVRTQPNVFYMGATGGGVWKSENFGIT